MMTVRAGTMALWVWLMLPLASLADITTGINWFATQQHPDGSFGSTATSLATPVQTTAETLRACRCHWQGNAS